MIKKKLNSIDYKNKHIKSEKLFVRNRKLTFKRMILFMMMKSVKSLQISLNEFVGKLDENFSTVTASAYSKSRKNISHTAFIELSKEVVCDIFYSDYQFKKFKGYRLLGIDGSKIVLPNSSALKNEFGKIEVKNQNGNCGSYTGALVSIMYDVLNGFTLDCKISPSKTYEGDLALQHLEETSKNDISIYDRGYPSYILFAKTIDFNRHFIARCSRKSFKAVNEMFNSNDCDKIVTIEVPPQKKQKCEEMNLPSSIKIRLIKVFLKNDEVEILATSLLDSVEFPTEVFKDLYWKRWQTETFYMTLKDKLNLENFTGKSVEAVKQDLYSSIFVANLERLATFEAEEKLNKKSKHNKNPMKVNKSVSINTIKNKVIDLFYNDSLTMDEISAEMNVLFCLTPTPVRKDRSFLRVKNNSRKKVNYYKRTKKQTF